jgi:C4-dicarboxylate-specific signal transduction histidine kinase
MKDKIVLEQILREKRIEALSHMAGGLAHEISNPLAIIHAMASDLRELATDNKPLESNHVLEVSDTIVRTSDRAMRILRGLKGFGREAGQDPMEYALIEGIIGECLELQDARFERHHVQLRLAVAKDLPPVFCRETQIGQIVTNLINNALDAIIQAKSAERWVALAATQLGDNLCIDVTDSGPGVEDQYKKRLMEPFFTTKHNSLGMGIGLSLSCAIAQDHQGSLSLLEETANTRFRLLLPLNPNPTREKSNEVR